jgi:glycosyltransferase involved in cell wall biosynthesis
MLPEVSILLPHFQTPELTMLCLRLLRRRTRNRNYEVIVIDNGSSDGSGAALGRLEWIRLIRRERTPDERPTCSHGLALNLGVAHARSPLVLIMHTDTMVLRDDWLDFLVSEMESAGPRCGIVGSWKIEARPAWRRIAKTLEDAWRRWRGKPNEQQRYIRSHCALYRQAAIRLRREMFQPSAGRSAGEELFEAISRARMSCRFLAPEVLCRYVCHLNHATMALNPEFGRNDPYMPRTRARAVKRIRRFFDAIRAEEILGDNSLDRQAG